MLSDTIHQALNVHLGHELYSAHLYHSIAADFAASGLRGISHWMSCQALEEHGHAARFSTHILERGHAVRLPAIDEPPHEWSSPIDAFRSALEHERKITGHIHSLMDLAHSERDHATVCFLQWFVTEQVEEESQLSEVVLRLGMYGQMMPAGVDSLDKQLGKRPLPTVYEIIGQT